MKTPWVIGIVAGAHVLAVAGIMLIQGCGTTTQGTIPPTAEVVMPPSTVTPPPAPVVPQPVPQVKQWPPASGREYIVKKGDSLSKIAVANGLNTRELAALNGIDNPNTIRIGQKLMLPGAPAVTSGNSAAPAPKKAPKKAPTAPVASGNTYVVKSGDCLSKIAVAHGCKTQDLRTLNSLKGDKIFVGQKLVLPKGSKATAPAPKTTMATAPVKATTSSQDKPAAPAKPEAKDEPSEAVDVEMAPAELPDPDLSATPSTDTREHIVGPDEDLPRIAMRYGVTVTRLKEVNGLVDGSVRTGQKIKIPIGQ